jgi:hypothetical protein
VAIRRAAGLARNNASAIRAAASITCAHSGDLERSFRSIMNTDSGDHEHPHEPA